MPRTTLAITLLLVISAITLYNPTSHLTPSIPQPSAVKSQLTNSSATVSIIPQNVSDLSKAPGSTVIFNVTLASSPSISAFNVWVRFDPRVLSASVNSIDYSGNILGSTVQVQSECINNQAVVGFCGILGGPGIVNLGLFLLGTKTTTVPGGLLYRLTLTVLKVGFSQIQLLEVALANGIRNESYQSTTVDGIFTNALCGSKFCTPPFVEFTFSPVQPSIGSTVTFNASASKATNLNAGIVAYTWFWDEICNAASISQNVTIPIVTHAFCLAQTYSVSLTVSDSLGISWTVTRQVQVSYLFIDVGIAGLTVAPSTSVPVGISINVRAVVINNSTIPETANATITAAGLLIANATFANMSPRSQQSLTGTWDTTGLATGIYNIVASVAPIAGANITSDRIKTVSVQLIQSADKPPIARFTFLPSIPVVGQNVFFDGSASYDPDGFIQLWTWDFGDHNGVSTSPSPIRGIAFLQPANYTVTLTVTDNAGLTGSTSAKITIRPVPPHDISLLSVNPHTRIVVSTQNVNVQIVLRNDGLNNESVTLTVLAGNQVIRSESGIFLQACPPIVSNVFCYNQSFEDVNWDTTGTIPGNYTISVTVTITPGETDPTPSDNNMTGGAVIVLPPPIVNVTPNSGPDGTKVQVTGAGFPTFQQNPFGFSGPILVTFDDMSVGRFFNAKNGSFTFTFDVLESQPGTHHISARDLNSGAHASTTFTVLPAPTGNLALTVDTGSVYFPGDTAVIYILTTFNGGPVDPSSVQLQVLLLLPNGTSILLSSTLMANGLYKATFVIPKTGPLGTYSILVKAHQSGPFDAAVEVGFELRQPWLSSNNGKLTVGATTLAALFGLVAVAWRKGYLRQKNEKNIAK